MPWLNKLWKIINKNWITFFSALALFTLVIFFISYQIFHSEKKENGFSKEKRFRIGRDPNLYPISLMGKERNLSAFVNELIFKIANDTDLKVEMVNVPFNLLFMKLDSHDVDAVISNLAPTPTNRPNYLFSLPIFEMGPVLVARENSNFDTLESLKGKNVGIRRGDSILLDHAELGILFVNYDSFLEALEDLERTRIEAVLMPASAAYTFTHVFYPGKLKVITSPLREEGLRLIATKSLYTHYLIETFNKGLKASFADGSYAALLARWGLVNPRKMLIEKDVETQ